MAHILSIYDKPQFEYVNNTGWTVECVKLICTQISVSSHYFLPVSYKGLHIFRYDWYVFIYLFVYLFFI